MPVSMTEPTTKSAAELESQIMRLANDGQLHQAAAACDRLNQSYPEYAPGWYTSSEVAMRLNEPALALGAVERALALEPARPEWVLRKLACLSALGEMDAAFALAEQLKNVKFRDAYHASNCGRALNRLGLHEYAERHFQHAVDLEPENGHHHYNLATVYRFMGRLGKARRSLNRAIRLNPADYESYLLRSSLKTQTPHDNNVVELIAALDNIEGEHPGRIQLCFALAKEFEDLEDYDRAFSYLEQGSAARRATMSYTPERELETMRAIREHYPAEVFENREQGFVNAEPVFVVGMPRTGTTLVDRILSSHSVVRSVGELQAFGAEVVRHCQQISGKKLDSAAELVPVTRQLDFEVLGEAYVNSARPRVNPAAHFIDKLPLNFLYLGLIHLALPKATIIALERDPMDTCYAIYKTMFQSAYPYSYDLRELANYYVGYRKLMAHWEAVMPGVIHYVSYEELVTDSRPVIEGLLSHCNLLWEDTCLNFHQNRAEVTTASAAQVRQAMHANSVGKWRHYERQLQPVADILNEAGFYE